jgi:cysteinyl-tRNA synthetase
LRKALLRVFSTLTSKIEAFKPRENMKVKMFSCGPSVYRRPHIGNYRTFLYEDVLHRYLEYLGYDVLRLTSLTDIEDKAISEAEKEGVSVRELAERNRKTFSEDSELLRMRSPDYTACMLACSSTAVEEAAKLVKTLLERDYAYYYKYEGRCNVYFDPLKFKDFGKLSKLNMNRWPEKKRRFHRDTYPGTPWNRGDFILWHGYKKGDADYWDTEIGKGRPAWNLQDAATITKYLGSSIDIACGGIDNLVRHHDYTIAIIEGISRTEFAHYWLHGQHLFVDGKKMSKTKGNVYYPSDLVRMGYSGEHIRFFLIYGHYRKRLNFTLAKFREARRKLDRFRDMTHELESAKSGKPSLEARNLADDIIEAFEKSMNNDLNVKAAFDAVFKIVAKLHNLRESGRLGRSEALAAITNLRKVDYILQTIFSRGKA